MVTLGFGFKSYVGYRIRQRKQREVAKDNDFYMQLLQEALPKDESTANGADSQSSTAAAGMAADHGQQDHQLAPTKEMVVSVAVTTTTLTTTTTTSATVIQQSNTNGHHHHHNNNHHNSSKNAQSHVNGHAGGGSGSSSAVVTATTSSNGSSTMNGGVNHSKHTHRKSLDKDSSATSTSGKANNGSSGSYSYHQQQQQTSNSAKEGSRSSTTDSPHSNGAASSPKEKKDCDSAVTALSSLSPTARSQFDSVPAASAQSQNSNHDKKHQQNGHVVNYEPSAAEHLQQQVESDHPVTEPKAASNRSGRKNRVKQKSDQQLAAVRLAATLALASSITTLTTTTAAATTTTTTAAAAAAASKDNHPSDAAPTHNTQNGSNQQQQTGPPPPPVIQTVVQTVKVCETCARMEADAKKLRTELGQLRQNENELRQKYDSNTTNLKSCLQVKQKEHDELQTR